MEKYQFTEAEQKVLETLPQAIAVYQFVDKKVVTLTLSQGFLELFGYTDPKEAYYDMDHDMYKDTHPDDVARIADAAYRFATETEVYDVIYRTKNKENNKYKIVHANGKHVFLENGVRLAYVWYFDEGEYIENGTSQNNNLSKALNNALHRESFLNNVRYDYLTGLPSVALFFEEAEEGKKKIKESGKEVAYVFFDFSGMKHYNHKYGFSKGDEYLKEFAHILAEEFGSEECCRFGQDHFGAYCKEEEVEEKVQRVIEENRKQDEEHHLSIRAGIYTTMIEDIRVSSAFDRAKLACDAIRGEYTSTYNFYDDSLRANALNRQYILDNFKKALEERRIEVHYQPIIRATNGLVCDEEALSRWNDPERGMLKPAEFIPILEESGGIYKLDLYVLEEILKKISLFKSVGLHVVPHSINLSRSDFTKVDMVDEICKRVDAANVEHNLIAIELTESVIGENFDFIKMQIDRFKELGFQVWMDDFGSGYSSLDVLQSIQFNVIKFDMSFMKKLDVNENSKTVLAELIKMISALGIETVCEGVETKEQANFLQSIGCSKFQGFFYCKAISLNEVLTRYETGKQIGFENPKEAHYYEAIGRVNLNDLTISGNEDESFNNYFDVLPMCVIEVNGANINFVRRNRSYFEFIKRYLDIDLPTQEIQFNSIDNLDLDYITQIKNCCTTKQNVYFDRMMPNGDIAHYFLKYVSYNELTKKHAVEMVVLMISSVKEGANYAALARALATDYYNIFYIDLKDESYIEYTSKVGTTELAMEGHGDNFFEVARKNALTIIYKDDLEQFLKVFTKEHILKELEEQGVYTITYRINENNMPVYMNMKIMKMQMNNHLVIGVSAIDSQMRQQEEIDRLKLEAVAYNRIMALAGDYLSLYTINIETNDYIEYRATKEYEKLGISKTGNDFFEGAITNGKKVVYKDDLPSYLSVVNKENILKEIKENGAFALQYRLNLSDKPTPVELGIVKIEEEGKEKLIAGVKLV